MESMNNQLVALATTLIPILEHESGMLWGLQTTKKMLKQALQESGLSLEGSACSICGELIYHTMCQPCFAVESTSDDQRVDWPVDILVEPM